MKKTTITMAAIAVISAGFAKDQSSDFSKFVSAMIPKAQAAFNNKDLRFFDMMSTADFKENMDGKWTNKKDSMAGMKHMFDSASSIKCKLKLLSSSAKNGVGTALTYDHMIAVLKPMKKGDTSHTMVMEAWMKETWVKVGSGWKIKKIENARPMKLTMDGKPFDPKMMGGGGH